MNRLPHAQAEVEEPERKHPRLCPEGPAKSRDLVEEAGRGEKTADEASASVFEH